ncbi:hypothetical protein HE1_00754 [Holospora elegans E1]|uniref:Uncharacterized protein n=1 Tax=Holospora elegans E1 TaxID=1427503 RepID=A0A023DYC5_9PROT|nr:hypothetical protein [Holospora elegans]GAJ46421.1 hypothetical protein HE1_00754 [Holospora elegans E1]
MKKFYLILCLLSAYVCSADRAKSPELIEIKEVLEKTFDEKRNLPLINFENFIENKKDSVALKERMQYRSDHITILKNILKDLYENAKKIPQQNLDYLNVKDLTALKKKVISAIEQAMDFPKRPILSEIEKTKIAQECAEHTKNEGNKDNKVSRYINALNRSLNIFWTNIEKV